MFLDVIRTANISDENTTSCPSVQTDDEDLSVYSRDDLLQPLIQLDTAPWSGETRWGTDSPWGTDEPTSTGGPWDSEGPWSTENQGSLNNPNDYGLRTEPWGTSALQTNDEFSDTTSEESLDSDSDDVDGGENNDGNSAQSVDCLKPDAERCRGSDLASYDSCVTNVDEHGNQVQHLETYPTQSRREAFDDVEIQDYLMGKTVAVDDRTDEDSDDDNNEDDDKEEENDGDDKEEEEDDDEEDSLNNDTKNKFKKFTVSSDIPVPTFDSEIGSLRPDQSWKDETSDKTDDGKAMDDGFKTADEIDVIPDVATSIHSSGRQIDSMREICSISDDEDFSVDEGHSDFLEKQQDFDKKIEEGDRAEDNIYDEMSLHQSASQVRDISLAERGDSDFELRANHETAEEASGKDICSEFKPSITDISFSSLDENDGNILDDSVLEMGAKNKDEMQERLKSLPSLHPELSTDTNEDATLPEKVLAVDEMLFMEEFLEDTKDDLQNREVSSFVYQTSESEVSVRKISIELEVGNDEEDPEERESCDREGNGEEEWRIRRNDGKSDGRQHHFSSSLQIGLSSFQDRSKEAPDARDVDSKSPRSLSAERDTNPGGDEGGQMRRGNVRSLIARFSILDSPHSETVKFDWNVSALEGRLTARLTSLEDAQHDGWNRPPIVS